MAATFEAYRWPKALRGTSFAETREALKQWALRHPCCRADGVADLEDANAFISRPCRPEQSRPHEWDASKRGYKYQSWGMRFLIRVYAVPDNKQLAYCVLALSSRTCRSSRGDFADSGALGCTMDNVIGAVVLHNFGGAKMVTQLITVSEVPGRVVPLDTPLFCRVELVSVKGPRYFLRCVFLLEDGTCVYTGDATFYKLRGEPTAAQIASRRSPDPEWVDDLTHYPLAELGMSDPAALAVFHTAVATFAGDPAFTPLPPAPCVHADSSSWERGPEARLTMTAFRAPHNTTAVGVVYFGRACLGPPGGLVNGGASLSVIDDLLRRLLRAHIVDGTIDNYTCAFIKVHYKHIVFVETAALVTACIEGVREDGAVEMTAEIEAAPGPGQAAWERRTMRRALIVTAVFAHDTARREVLQSRM